MSLPGSQQASQASLVSIGSQGGTVALDVNRGAPRILATVGSQQNIGSQSSLPSAGPVTSQNPVHGNVAGAGVNVQPGGGPPQQQMSAGQQLTFPPSMATGVTAQGGQSYQSSSER